MICHLRLTEAGAVPVRLRAAIFELGWGVDAKETDGSCPTHGKLLSFNQLIATVLNALDGA